MPEPSDAVNIECPAKVNLALSVGGRDDATGLHPLCSWMVAVDLCDTLTVRRRALDAPNTASTFAIGFAPDAPRAEQVNWPRPRDLAVRAHAACEAAAGRPLPVDVTLTKRIPTGGGLGGGSSNAAGILVALDRLFDSPLDPDTLHAIARGLGSDVPFALAALTGTPSAVVSGTGEELHPAPTPGGHLMLAIPPFGCPTAAVFAAFDQSPEQSNLLAASTLLERAAQRPLDPEGLVNDLYVAAQTVEPRLTGFLDALIACTDTPPLLTGAGAVCFIPADSDRHARELAQWVRASPDPALRDTACVAARFPYGAAP